MAVRENGNVIFSWSLFILMQEIQVPQCVYSIVEKCSFFSLVCAMGGTSSTSRLFGTLAQSLNSAPLDQIDLDLEQNLTETDPDQLLRECEEALQKRPARPHRDLVFPNVAAPCHKHDPSIRIMQWNILAQGSDHCFCPSIFLGHLWHNSLSFG